MGVESPDTIYKEKLIRGVKKEVKQIMEEAVTKKFVHEDSGSITSLCCSVELCLSHGLKRRALGLFKSSSTTALLHKVAKSFQPAATIVQLVTEAENCDPNKRSSSGSESASKLPLISSMSTGLIKPPLQKRNSSTQNGPTTKFLWIRLALFEKLLARIIDHIVITSSKYYEKYALVSDSDYGSILSSLLVGPCALDFSKLRTGEFFWTDPPADELVQRHKISSAFMSSTPASPPFHKRPGLQYKRSTTSSTLDDSQVSKDYVESLHQNHKSTLLYGKNNVLMTLKEAKGPLAGYLSLHQCGEILNLKWTPNQLMSTVPDNSIEKNIPFESSVYWEHAMNVVVHEIVYVHCHQDDESDWIVLIGQDGVQRPPLYFPRGGHLLAFLSCLENGLLPHALLDPPLWSQTGKGKMFPKLKRKGSKACKALGDSEKGVEEKEEIHKKSDFVFRIVYNFTRTYEQMEEVLENPLWKCVTNNENGSPLPITPRSTPLHSSSTSSSKSIDSNIPLPTNNYDSGEPIQVVCETMRRQIISRAFYGWLSHCRHLRTVRTHLVGLVHPTIIQPSTPPSPGLTVEKWVSLTSSLPSLSSLNMSQLNELVYLGGMEHSLRKEVWPLLLSQSGSGLDIRECRREYEERMGEWMVVETVVRERDREILKANMERAKSSTGSSGEVVVGPPHSAKSLSSYGSNEVFEECSNGSCGSPKMSRKSLQSTDSSKWSPVEKRNKNGFSPTPLRKQILEKIDKVLNEKNNDIVEKNVENEKNSETNSDSETNNENNSEKINEKNEDDVKISEKSEAHVVINEKNCDKNAEDKKAKNCENEENNEEESTQVSAEVLEIFGLNVHRIDKDVKRCDRNYPYFMDEKNLEKLRNIMCTYVWEHLDIGYVQGMCDLAAPLLVILDDEALSYSCFKLLMSHLSPNFPIGGGGMDAHFSNMRSLLQVLDNDLYALFRERGDYTHFYFSYRWFLLDFKREFCYQDIFLVWETIWAAREVASNNFVLFLALALLHYYRDIILSNAMDFTDIIKFFNEMAERHDAKTMLQIARNLVLDLQILIEDK